MSLKTTITSRSTSRRIRITSKSVEAIRRADFELQRYVTMVKLHIQASVIKAKPSTGIPPQPRPFTHSNISSLSCRLEWNKVETL